MITLDVIDIIVIAISFIIFSSLIAYSRKVILRQRDKLNTRSGRIVINMSNPNKEYFECELYSEEFFKNVHQKEYVIFDVVIR